MNEEEGKAKERKSMKATVWGLHHHFSYPDDIKVCQKWVHPFSQRGSHEYVAIDDDYTEGCHHFETAPSG